jgi:hypothetical protein
VRRRSRLYTATLSTMITPTLQDAQTQTGVLRGIVNIARNDAKRLDALTSTNIFQRFTASVLHNPLSVDEIRQLHVLILSRKRVSPGLSAIRKLSRNGLWEVPSFGSTTRAKVNSLGSESGLVIAFHSPDAPRGTALRMCLREKTGTVPESEDEQFVLCSPVCAKQIPKYRHCSRISELSGRNFPALQTEWRREKDSNPGYRC